MKVEHGHDKTQISTVLQICMGLGIVLRIQPWQIDEDIRDEWQ